MQLACIIILIVMVIGIFASSAYFRMNGLLLLELIVVPALWAMMSKYLNG